MTSLLFSPITLAGLTLPNRIMVSPMCMYSAHDGLAESWHQQHLATLAQSGAALLVIEATAVEARGRISPGCLGLWNDQQEEAFARLLAELRKHSDIRVGIQLGHSGRKGSRAVMMPRGSRALDPSEGGWSLVGPSALPYAPGYATPEELDEAGLHQVREAFVSAARRADRAGFDHIEIHGAHGYLLHAFRAPNSNQRTDRYGGGAENRHRFPLEVARAMRRAFSVAKPIGYRLNAEDWHDDGVSLAETIDFSRALRDIGIDYVTTSGGAGSPRIQPPAVAPGYMTGYSATVRKEAGIATVAVGMILTAQQAESTLAEGKADMVAIGRGMLDDPRWAHHAAAALGETPRLPLQYSKALPGAWPGYKIVHTPGS